MRFRNLEKYKKGGTNERMKLEVPVPKTPDGRVYRYSPNELAHPRHFVLGDTTTIAEPTPEMRSRMKLPPRSKQGVCPYSGIIANDDEFTHPDDVKAAIKTVEHAALADVDTSLQDMLGDFNRGQKQGGLIKLEASMQTSSRVRPRFYRKDLLRELVCDHCGRDYGVYAIGLFCPDCGAPNLKLHFTREVDLVETQVALAEAQSDDSQELAYRLLGNAHEDVLTGFEATLKTVYLYGKTVDEPSANPIKVKNDFQNIKRARSRFAELGIDPFITLDKDELSTLGLNIQKRHLVGHNLGVIDALFVQHAEDAKVGEIVQLLGEDIQAFASLCQRVIDALDTWLGEIDTQAIAVSVGRRESSALVDANLPDDAADRSAKELGLSPLAFHVGCFLAAHSENGLTYPVNEEPVVSEFVDIENDELCEAVAELEVDGYLETTAVTNQKLPRMRYLLELFATFDPHTTGNDPSLDAAELAARVLEGDDSVSVAELHDQSGWDRRRFNPALGILIEHVDERRVSNSNSSDYPTRHFHLLPADRVELKRYIARVRT